MKLYRDYTSRHMTSFQRLYDVYTTSLTSYRCRIDAETTSCVYWVSSFQMEMFKEDLDQNLKCTTSFEYSDFRSIFNWILQNHAPIKKRILRFNNSPFMTKTLRKPIMHRSKFKNIYNKKRTDDNWINYKKQMNFCVNLLRKTKKDYFQNLNILDLFYNRKFWKTIKPYFNNKGLNSSKLLPIEKGNIALNEK